ncbi:P-loop containing nucleoside triphosphate hydrolase protein [Schizophyllum commune Loenen D]|nr:P-loop containing nucleoside triphosphate hydrolase protein [Schizophyllum commune Loenen D]
MSRVPHGASLGYQYPADAFSGLELTKKAAVDFITRAGAPSDDRLFTISALLNCIEDAPYPRMRIIHLDDLIHCVRAYLHKPDAAWRSVEQRAAIIALLRLTHDVIVAMGTSAGKSVIALAPSFAEDGLTVIAVPLRSLRKDWMRRMDDGNIAYYDFAHANCGPIPRGTKVVLVSVDILRSDGWIEALREARLRGMPIMRIVIDEAQMILTSQDFRKRLREIYEVRTVECPIVLLTANATPDTIPYFVQEFGLADPIVIRTLADRPEIKYMIENSCPDAKDAAKRIQELIVGKLQIRKDRWIVFVTKIADGYALAAALGVQCYHARRRDGPYKITDQELQSRLNDWISGKCIGIVATSALACGNDFAHVRIVFHWGVPRTLIDFLQEAGRAARDGRPGWSIVFPNKPFAASNAVPLIRNLQGHHVIHYVFFVMANELRATDPEKCMRRIFNLFNDGLPLSCFEILGAQRCHFCDIAYAALSQAERERRCRLQHTPNVAPPLQPLVAADHAPSSASQIRKLLRDGFHASVQAAEARTMDRMAMTTNQIKNWEDLLADVGQHSCGFCYVQWKLGRFASRAAANLHHELWDCRSIPSRQQWQALRLMPKYDESGDAFACYSCHFATMGNDRLHGEYSSRKSGNHPDLEFVLPALWAVWLDDDLRAQAFRDLQVAEHNHVWDSLVSLCRWLVDPAATNSLVTGKSLFPVPGMAFMEWLRRRFEIGDMGHLVQLTALGVFD